MTVNAPNDICLKFTKILLKPISHSSTSSMHQPNGRGKNKHQIDGWHKAFHTKTDCVLHQQEGKRVSEPTDCNDCSDFIFSVGIFLLTSKATCNHANTEGTTFKRINHICWAQQSALPQGSLASPAQGRTASVGKKQSKNSLSGGLLKTALLQNPSRAPSACQVITASSWLPSLTDWSSTCPDAFWQLA